jgi:serine/arginine repetitive matrix protein 2
MPKAACPIHTSPRHPLSPKAPTTPARTLLWLSRILTRRISPRAIAFHHRRRIHRRPRTQFSPGFVREILPGEIVYSPFMSERSTTPEEDKRETNVYAHNRKSTATILDTVGLGEALAYAVEEENTRDSGLGTSEDHAQQAEEWGDDGQAAAAEAHHPYRIHRKPVQYDISRPLYTPKKSGVSSNTNHTVASSPVDPTVSHEHRLTPPTPAVPSNPSGSSPAMNSVNSAASSPPRSPPPIGSVDDLDDFRDLFYKPNLTDEVLNNLSRPPSTRQHSITWDLASTTRTQRTRTGSGLTSLARQLSQEFEELRAVRHRTHTDSMGSDSSISRFSGRFPTETDIHFVFGDSEMSRGVDEEDPVLPAESEVVSLSAFRASSHLPEDVESSRASSPIDGPVGGEDEDDHGECFTLIPAVYLLTLSRILPCRERRIGGNASGDCGSVPQFLYRTDGVYRRPLRRPKRRNPHSPRCLFPPAAAFC